MQECVDGLQSVESTGKCKLSNFSEELCFMRILQTILTILCWVHFLTSSLFRF